MTEATRKRVEYLIELVISQFTSAHFDAGWHQISQIDWCKQVMDSKAVGGRRKALTAVAMCDDSGGSIDHDRKMPSEVRFLRREHAELKKAVVLISRLDTELQAAVLAASYYRVVYKRKHTIAQVAERLGIDAGLYRSRRDRAMRQLADAVELVQALEAA